MSISQDDKLSQLIKDYFESGGSTATDSCFYLRSGSSRLDDDDDHPTHYFNLQEILEDHTEAENEIYGKVLTYLRDVDVLGLENINKIRKWIVFKLEMDNYEAHLSQTSWSTPFDCPLVSYFTGNYEYVEVVMRDKDSGTGQEIRLIVDLDFRTQFELARPTPNYEELRDAIPLIFVGNEEKIEKLVCLICSAAKQSLTERGLHIPPWRKESYMKSKWLSTNRKRVSSAEFMSCLSTYMTQNGNACFLDFVQVDQQLGTYNC